MGAACMTLGPWAAGAQDIRRQLRFSLAMVNPHAHELRDQMLWIYGPAGETQTQKLRVLTASVDHEILTDEMGHRIIALRVPALPPFGRKVVTVDAVLALRDEPMLQTLTDPEQWLRSERYIEVGDPDVKSVAHQLQQAAPIDTARAIFDWVRGHLLYAGYVADDLGAVYALSQRRGDCTEYAYLATALARANGIPARMVGGYVVDRDTTVRSTGYHNWCEVFLDGAWRLLDAQKENWLVPAQRYVAFRIYRDRALNPIGLAHRFRVGGDMQVEL